MKKGVELPSLWWTDIDGYEGLYKASIDGDVKSLITGKIRKLRKGTNGYLLVDLYKDGKGKTYLVHRLVAQAFIPNPDNLPEVNHIDEDKTNNRVENLEWCTRQYNNNWGTAIQRAAEKNINGKRSKAVIAIDPKTGKVAAEFPSTMEAERNGYCSSNVAACCRGKQYSAKGFIWCYKGTSDEEISKRITEYLSSERTRRERISKTKTNGKQSKPVVALDKQGRIVHVFPSMMEAERNGYCSSSIGDCCKGKYKYHHGLIWRYQNDFLKEIC